jgi:hypothetical protein
MGEYFGPVFTRAQYSSVHLELEHTSLHIILISYWIFQSTSTDVYYYTYTQASDQDKNLLFSNIPGDRSHSGAPRKQRPRAKGHEHH